MTNIVPFSFESHQVRVITDEMGEPWFNATDVCDVLEYTNARDAIANHVDADDVAKRDTIDSLGRVQQANHINESGLYALILGSKKKEAKRFKRWVTAEVLPAIRKTGSYSVNQPTPIPTDKPTKVFTDFFKVARLIGLDKNAAALGANQATTKKTGENVLLLMGVSHLETDQPWFTPTELGKRVGVSGRQFNLLLMEAGLQTKEGDHWLPTDAAKGLCRFFDTSKRHSDGTIVQQMKWSQSVTNRVSMDSAA